MLRYTTTFEKILPCHTDQRDAFWLDEELCCAHALDAWEKVVSEGDVIREAQALGLWGEPIEQLLTSPELRRLEIEIARQRVEAFALMQLLRDPLCCGISGRIAWEGGGLSFCQQRPGTAVLFRAK